MRQNKFFWIIGLWLIALSFIDFSQSLHNLFLVLTGLFMIITVIKKGSVVKTNEELIKEIKESETKS